jgi:tRNA A37 threonylcarbamoyladenosine modification protein TsaB
LYEVESADTWPKAVPLMDERVARVADAVSDLASKRGKAPICLMGNGIEKYKEKLIGDLGEGTKALEERYWAPSAYWMARMGHRRFLERGPDDMDTVEPVYLRKPDAKLPG